MQIEVVVNDYRVAKIEVPEGCAVEEAFQEASLQVGPEMERRVAGRNVNDIYLRGDILHISAGGVKPGPTIKLRDAND